MLLYMVIHITEIDHQIRFTNINILLVNECPHIVDYQTHLGTQGWK